MTNQALQVCHLNTPPLAGQPEQVAVGVDAHR